MMMIMTGARHSLLCLSRAAIRDAVGTMGVTLREGGASAGVGVRGAGARGRFAAAAVAGPSSDGGAAEPGRRAPARQSSRAGQRSGSLSRASTDGFEPVQGMAAQKFTPENRSVRSIVKDLSGGQAPKTIFRNAMLSIETKKKICELHASDPTAHSAEALAKQFKVSEQRVLAIIALAELREKHYAEGGALLNQDLNVFMEKWFGNTHKEGDGEKHLSMATSEPRFRVGDLVFGNLGASSLKEEKSDEQKAAEDAAARLARFKERLDWNMCRTGASINRKPRPSMDIKRPKDGWNLVVTPTSSIRKPKAEVGDKKKKKKNSKKNTDDEAASVETPYVAIKGGTRRDLTPDELMYLKRTYPSLRS